MFRNYFILPSFMRYTYMLRCSDDSLYTGITTNLEKRISDHNESPAGAKYTKARRPVELVRSEEHPDKSSASKREYEIKRWKKEKKEALVVFESFPEQQSSYLESEEYRTNDVVFISGSTQQDQ